MHKYEFYGEWDNCDFYWNTSIDNKNIEIKSEEPIENINSKNTNTEIKKNVYELVQTPINKNNYYRYKINNKKKL
jgi:hypothetical protein